jgi:hypothetical protein
MNGFFAAQIERNTNGQGLHLAVICAVLPGPQRVERSSRLVATDRRPSLIPLSRKLRIFDIDLFSRSS